MRTLLILCALLALAVAGLFWQGQRGARSAQELSSLKNTVSEAVVARSAAVGTDARQAAQKGRLVDSVRSAVVLSKSKGKDAEIPAEGAGCPAGLGVNLGLLNEAIVRANRAIAAANELPEQVQ